jgi:hypothetical protein
MEQRLRLVQGISNSRHERRGTDRLRIEVPGQIVWKDAKGATRMADVVTRDISKTGVCVVCQGTTPIPLYRLCYFQVDRSARHRLDLPAVLRKSSVLSAIFRVGATNDVTGTPSEYGLRLLVEPASATPVKAVWSDERKTRTA